ncbi:HEAT repeat domain-containing protein [Streptomyces antimicrobicus]|uniref:HEAT repeat domain-containing protein n=1 Tax=Streptomyces antimicrobicus TaxID=2883108 RepID=A0ABS8BFS8_9ACTN|nr:HEAT repeat domain-containing protein [Streptomyces antimicrobicus]MCB5183480.1 HEAT repeat domain-containing protein [Streptomyces antimicrobicus]
MFEPVIAPSGTLLGLLQRGRGDGTLHALAAPRPEALAALNECVLNDPRRDWQVENRSLYYARLYLDLDGPLTEIEAHLFGPDDLVDEDESRTGLALSVLGHLASYGRDDALMLLRRYAAVGANWAWALDELALRDDDAGLRGLAGPVLGRFPATAEGEARLAAAVRDAYEPRPWRLWEELPAFGDRLRAARQQGSFDRWQRQLTPSGPRPGWGVAAVFAWAEDGLRRGTPLHVPAARCLAAVATPEDRAEIFAAAAGAAGEAARATALHHLVLAEPENPAVLDLIEAAGDEAAVAAYERMCGPAALARARVWVHRQDALGTAAASLLASRGGPEDSALVLAALRTTVRTEGPDAHALFALVDGVGRLSVGCAAPLLRHIYRETSSSHLRGRAACALARTDPSFPAGFAVECLWDCEETTREIAARHAETADARVTPRLRRLAADPAEEEDVQSAVRSRIAPESAV